MLISNSNQFVHIPLFQDFERGKEGGLGSLSAKPSRVQAYGLGGKASKKQGS